MNKNVLTDIAFKHLEISSECTDENELTYTKSLMKKIQEDMSKKKQLIKNQFL
jgi:hypothetical protein